MNQDHRTRNEDAREGEGARGRTASVLVISLGTLCSRALGFFRDVAFAAVWGTDMVLAVFLIAWTLPNLLRSFFGEGAFSAAFVPSFSAALEKDGEASAWQLAGRALSVLLLVLTSAVLLLAGAAWGIASLLSGKPAGQLMSMVAWLMPYTILICMTAGLTGILNTFHKFALPAFSQLLLNIFLIGFSLLAWRLAPEGQVASNKFLVAGILIAGVCQLFLLWLACRACGGKAMRFEPRWRSPEVKGVFSLMAPALLGAGVHQVNVLVDRALAISLGGRAVTSLYFSQRLVYLPVGLFAVAGATVSLPAMARAWARRDNRAVETIFLQGVRQTLFFSLPCFFLLLILHRFVVELAFLRGNFSVQDAGITAWTLLFYLPGIPAFVLAKIAIVPFHARKDTRTPVRIALLCLGLNVVLNLILMQVLAQGGLALATAVCSWVNVGLLMFFLRDKIGLPVFKKILPGLGKLAVAALCGTTACSLSVLLLQALNGDSFGGRLAVVLGAGGVGGLTYLGACLGMRCPEAWEVLHVFRKKWAGTG